MEGDDTDTLLVRAMNAYYIAEHNGGKALGEYMVYGESKEMREKNFRNQLQSVVANTKKTNAKQRCKLFMAEAKAATAKVQKLIRDADQWDLVHFDKERGLRLSEITTEAGEYIFRVEGEIAAPAEMVKKMNLQCDPVPRQQWDKDLVDIRMVEVLKHGTLWVLDSVARINVPMVWDRRYVGLQWYAEVNNGDHYLVTQSISPELRKTLSLCERNGTVDASGFSGMIIRPVDTERCYITMVVQIKPGGWIPDSAVAWAKEELLDRLTLFETAYQKVLIQ